MNWAN